MDSKEALEYLTIEATTDFQKSENSKSNCFKWQKVIEKDLEMLDCFKRLFEGEDLHSWIEFDFSGDYKEGKLKDSDYTGWISTMLKIRKYLEDEEKEYGLERKRRL